jgi:hypothetical protein
VKEQQYVVARRQAEDKPFLARIRSIKKDGSVIATLEKDIHFKRSDVTLEKKHIKVNLGINPMPGKAYGLDLDNLYKKTIDHGFWGQVHFFITPDSETMTRLKKALDSSAKIVQKIGLEGCSSHPKTQIVRTVSGMRPSMLRM